jgi:hypothetical protein
VVVRWSIDNCTTKSFSALSETVARRSHSQVSVAPVQKERSRSSILCSLTSLSVSLLFAAGGCHERLLLNSLSHIQLATEDDRVSRGSCCDDGRYVFAPCGNWWYNCPNWGLANYTQWIRFSRAGFTMPTGSEHGAKCTYSPEKRVCPRPQECKRRVPVQFPDICDEIPTIERTFPVAATGVK